jgi:hypothetical protein
LHTRHWTWLAMLIGLDARAQPVGRDGRPSVCITATAPTGQAQVCGDRRLTWTHGTATVVLAENALGAPAIDAAGRHLVASVERADGVSLQAWSHTGGRWVGPRQLVTDVGRPDRPALSLDGQRVAYVSGATGVSSVYIVPFDGGTPRQLTNASLTRQPGMPPDGFVPPPHRGPPVFLADTLVWDAPDGPQSVALP